MQILPPLPPDQRPPIPAFTPVPRKYRHDGWTPERQRAFIDALAATGSVTAAAARINMSTEGAYYLRRQPGAEQFAASWAAALDHGVQHLTDLAIDRATHGTPVPIFWKGEQVGERRRYNDRLLMFILKHHLPARYGGAMLPAPPGRETTAQEEEAQAVEALDAWLRPRATGLMGLLRAHRLALRHAVVAHLIGDADGAAAAEHTARIMEERIAGDPDGWLSGDLWSAAPAKDMPGGAEDAPAFCRDGAIPAPPDPAPPEGACWLDDPPPGSPLDVLPHHYPLAHISGGPTLPERQAARRDARQRRDAAQAEMEAAYDEVSWAAWLGAGD